MGQFSWFTQDTKRRIRNGVPFTVYMTDDKGNKYKETCYGGYGVFGGKDYYELLAEMNGIVDRNKEYLRQIGIELVFKNSPQGYNPEVKHPSLTENGSYYQGVAPISDPDQGFPLDYHLAGVPSHVLTEGMEVLLPKDATFIDVNGVSMFLPTLNLYETITVDDMYPFGNCLVQSIREDKSIMLKDLTSGLEFRYSGNVLIRSNEIVHSYMGNNNKGDLVLCNDCETLLLVPMGTDICPDCHSDGCLTYPDDRTDHVHATQSELREQGNIVITHDRPTDEMLYS